MWQFVLIILITVLILGWFIFLKYLEKSWGTVYPAEEEVGTGKIVIVTGGNSGIGKATILELVKRGCTCIMASRNIASAQEAIADIRRETSAGEIVSFLNNKMRNFFG